MEIEKITQKVSEPSSFPCAFCAKNKAEFKAKFRRKETTVSLCLCSVCKNLPETILIERIFGEME